MFEGVLERVVGRGYWGILGRRGVKIRKEYPPLVVYIQSQLPPTIWAEIYLSYLTYVRHLPSCTP